MEDIRCTKCGRLLAKNAVVSYIEIKCKCGAYNVIDRSPHLTNPKKPTIMKVTE